jgi:hypothetical protein
VPSKGASEAQSEQARALTAKKGIKTNLEVREKKEEKWGERPEGKRVERRRK